MPASGRKDPRDPELRSIRGGYAAAFGRFAPSRQAEPPADEVLVGREGERSYLVDLLISTGRQGAYLVTGRRGAGKTSFVQRSIDDYENSVFKRFLRADVGRGFWDRMALVVVIAVLLLAGFLLSDLAALLIPHAAFGRTNAHAVLLWLALAPVLILLLWPIVYAFDILRLALWDPTYKYDSKDSTRERFRSFDSQRKTLGAGLWTALITLGIALLPGSAEHQIFSMIFLMATLLSLGGLWWHPVSLKVRRCSPRTVYFFSAALYIAVTITSFASLAFSRFLSDAGIAADHEAPYLTIASSVILGLLLAATSLALRWRNQVERARPQDDDDDFDQKDSFRDALVDGGKRFLIAARFLGLLALSLSFACCFLTNRHGEYFPLITGGLLVVVAVTVRFARTNERILPPVRFLLVTKAFACIALSLLLTSPLIVGVADSVQEVSNAFTATQRDWLEPEKRIDIVSAPSRFIAWLTDSDRPYELREDWQSHFDHWRVAGSRLNQEPRQPPFTFDTELTKPLGCLALLLLLALTFYFLEYEWVVKPQISWREDYFSDPAVRPSYEDRTEFCPIERDQEERPDTTQRDPIPRLYFRRLAEATIPWQVYRVWLPVLSVRVNLGFDRLEHRRIIHAMLLGLREHYYRTFLSLRSPLANIARVVTIALALSIVVILDDAWFKLPHFDEPPEGESICAALLGSDGGEANKARSQGAWSLICQFSEKEDGWLQLVYFDLFTFQQGVEQAAVDPSTSTFWEILLPYSPRSLEIELVEKDTAGTTPATEPSGEGPEPLQPSDGGEEQGGTDTGSTVEVVAAGHNLFAYHLLLLVASFLIVRRSATLLPTFPYARNLRRIDDLLDSLSSTRRVTKRDLWKPARWIYDILGGNTQETETTPLDPRTVELAFLKILQEIQRGGLRFPSSASEHLSFPAPEITFVFDELDKLGSRPDPEGEEATQGVEEARAIHAERVRSLALRSLLSDLKNILASADARFIFVGGRNLYDEWLADQTARQPLLTNIFNAVVYLPSLLADYGGRTGLADRTLSRRIREYLFQQERRAWYLYRYWLEKRWTPALGLSSRHRLDESFVQARPQKEELGEFRLALIDLDDERSLEGDEALDLTESFIKFLTYRSMGNPKKLKELLGSFVRPAGRVFFNTTDIAVARAKWPCRHVLQFGDIEILRIQLLTDIYSHLEQNLERRLLRRDDKLAISVLFLTDFLFKFHRRAFSWSNLERVDELVHIHRAPDLRETLEEIVDQASERYLQRLLNGMYAFRFRAEVAKELEYISRQSPGEMAAFNFTLDESQSLKALYEAAIAQREDVTPGLVAGLGELYEFDHEFETARHYYARAIHMLDLELERRVSGQSTQSQVQLNNFLTEPGTSAREAAGQRPEIPAYVLQMILECGSGEPLLRFFATWIVRRLRLRLQVGMTFEQARNHELAQTQYQSAGRLANATLRAYLRHERNSGQPAENSGSTQRLDFSLHLLKHLNILFQPAFAEAWVAEKHPGGIDTSTTTVEEYLWLLRSILPFVSRRKVPLSTDATQVSGSNFALIVSQMHNKAGDLHFLKGRSPFAFEDLVATTMESDRSIPFGLPDTWKEVDEPAVRLDAREGYLLRAHYHYAVSLHDLRRFLYHRYESSRFKYNIVGPVKDLPPAAYRRANQQTFESGRWPDFVFRAAGGDLCDMAEALLARASFFRLVDQLESLPRRHTSKVLREPASHETQAREFKKVIFRWLESDSQPQQPAGKLTKVEVSDRIWIELDELETWIGSWQVEGQDYRSSETIRDRRLIDFDQPHDALDRFVMAVYLGITGAVCFEDGGYPEDSARELGRVCEVVEHYLFWVVLLHHLDSDVRNALKTAGLESEVSLPFEDEKHEDQLSFWLSMASLTTYATRRALRNLKTARFDDKAPVDTWKIGKLYPPEFLTRAISLLLLTSRLPAQSQERQRRNVLSDQLDVILQCVGREKFCGLLKEVLEVRDTKFDVRRDDSRLIADLVNDEALLRHLCRSILIYSLTRHRFPILNRLNGSQALLLDACFDQDEDVLFSKHHFRRISDFMEDVEIFSAPFHFTPLKTGTVCSLLYLSYHRTIARQKRSKIDDETRRKIDETRRKTEVYRVTALKELRRSREMYTQQRGYYEAISRSYYLYDDFNDRYLHFQHALQMASAEMNAVLQRLVEEADPAVIKIDPV